MTQLFLEDGRVERVTVLEAGPCPVTAIRTAGARRLRGRPARLRRRAEKALTKAELGHLKKADAPPLRHLEEFRDEAGELKIGDTVTVEASRTARRSRSPAPPRARASRARSSATTSPPARSRHGSHNVRAPGSIGASATPSRVFKGIRGPGQMGNKRVTQSGLTIVERDRRPEPDARPRRGARAPRAAPWRCAPMADAPILGGTKQGRRSTTPSSARSSTARSCTRPCAPSWPRAARAPHRPRRAARSAAAAPSRGARRAPAAPAPARSGPAVDRRRHRLRPEAAPLHRQGQPQGAPRRAARALSLHAERGSLVGARRRPTSTRPRPSRPPALLDGPPRRLRAARARHARRPPCAKSFRNLARVNVLPAEDVGVADIIGAATLVASQAALDALTDAREPRRRAQPRRRRAPDGRPPGDHPPGRLREDLRAARRPTSTPSASTPTRTRPRSARPSRRSSTSTSLEVRTLSVKSKPKRRGYTSGRTRAVEEGRSSRCTPGDTHPALRGPGG